MKVLTIGTFDLLHYGHINLLKRCEALGEVVVGVNSDAFVKRYKGKAPIMDENTRTLNIKALGYDTELNDGSGKLLIREILPNIVAVGSDWARKDYLAQIGVTQEELDEWDVSIIYVPYTEGISSSLIKSSL